MLAGRTPRVFTVTFFKVSPKYRSPGELPGEETEAQRRRLAKGHAGSPWEPGTPTCAGRLPPLTVTCSK